MAKREKLLGRTDPLAVTPACRGMAMFIDAFIQALTNCGDISIDEKQERITNIIHAPKKGKKGRNGRNK